jgi:dimethylhistidine N-methyltransferase
MTGPGSAVASAVLSGLSSTPRRLPSWLFYDAAGSALYEQITKLPEYYLTRAEFEIFEHRAAEILSFASDDGAMLALAEIGAGTATKTELLVRAALSRFGRCRFLASDISPEALHVLQSRFSATLPEVELELVTGEHAGAVRPIAALAERQLVLFVGSSIGNYGDEDAVALLRMLRGAMRGDAVLVLGTDLRKSPERLVAAYDDRAGVTAAFNRNMLVRINRELSADFDVERFRHVALWNERASNMEMHLEAIGPQRVRIERLGLTVDFLDGERIHTESSAKYDEARIDKILSAAGFRRETTLKDREGLFGVQLARVVAG